MFLFFDLLVDEPVEHASRPVILLFFCELHYGIDKRSNFLLVGKYLFKNFRGILPFFLGSCYRAEDCASAA